MNISNESNIMTRQKLVDHIHEIVDEAIDKYGHNAPRRNQHVYFKLVEALSQYKNANTERSK